MISDRRPTKRIDCVREERPCPWVSCSHHLALDVDDRSDEKDLLRFTHGDAEIETLDAMPETCALDVADRGAHTLHDVARVLNLTKERVRQIELIALAKLRKNGGMAGL